MEKLTNYTFDEISIGQRASFAKTVEEQDIQMFAAVSGDVNPIHLDAAYAATTPFKERIAHGMLTGAVVSAALAMRLPGPGTIYLGQSLRFRAPVTIGDTVTAELTVTEKRDDRRQVTLDCQISNQHGKVVASGEAQVIAPDQKLELDAPPLPRFRPA